MHPKVVVFVHHCATRSGAANSLLALIKCLDRNIFSPVVLCPEGSAAQAFREVVDVLVIPELPEVASVSGNSFHYLRLLKSVALYKNLPSVVALIESLKPAIVHLNELSLTPLAKRLKRRGFKVVIHARIVLNKDTKVLNRWIISRIQKYSDKVICIDGSVKNSLKNLKHASIVYNSYQFRIREESFEYKLPEDRFVVLFLANLIKYKGVFDLLDAADLLRSYRDIEIWIAGGNSRPDVFFERNTGRVLDKLGIVMNNRKRIERIIDKNQLSNVKLLGVVSQPEQLIVKSSVLIFPSYMNGPSRSVFEAGVFSRPSIISLNDKIEDVVKDQITGTIIDEGSPQQIVEAILQLYNDRRKLEEMGGNARIKYLAMNDPYQNIKSIEKIYKLLL